MSKSIENTDILSDNLIDNITELRRRMENSSDFLERQITLDGIKISLIMCEGMVNLELFSHTIVESLKNIKIDNITAEKLLSKLRYETILAADQKEVLTFSDIFTFIMSGFVVILIDGIPIGIACGLQGYNFRSVGEVTTEANVRGSKEGFVEPLRVNQTLIRRRIKSPNLKFEILSVGEKSKTDISLVYLTDTVSKKLVADVKRQLTKITPDIILNSGYIQPFLEKQSGSFFGGTGITERPDTLCAKINEGRIGILVDGTPFAIIVPYLFIEHFQSIDDYAYRPYFAFFVRCLKFIAFFISVLLPGIYVAAVSFHPELIPHALLFNIAAAEETTPFPIIFEALIIHILYEIMREAGLRLPKAIGHAVSIVGAIVIGDAAVNAGLASAPMVMVVALTAISAFSVQSLYEQVAVLKFVFIIIGGCLGLFGVVTMMAILLINMCAVNNFGLPFTAPVSPFSSKGWRDVIVRMPWRLLGKKAIKIQNLKGSEINE